MPRLVATSGRKLALHSAMSGTNCRIDIEPVSPLETAGWDDWAADFASATCFHASTWLRAIHETYGHAILGWIARDGNRIVGMLPVVEIDSVLTGKRGVSVAFADLAEPLATSSAAVQALRDAAMDAGRARGWRTLEFRGGGEHWGGLTASTAFVAHELDLAPGETKLFAQLGESVRRNIRKAEREGLKVEISRDREAIAHYYRLHCMTRQRLGSPPQPLRFFSEVARHCFARGGGFVVLCWYAHRPIAGLVVLEGGRTALYKFGASDAGFLHLRPNELAMWHAIRQSLRDGMARYHFGRTSVGNAGLRRFKAGFGAGETELCYWKFDLATDTTVAAPDRANGWANHIVRYLPQDVVNAIGRTLYRHLS